jgi:hypothetical protein
LLVVGTLRPGSHCIQEPAMVVRIIVIVVVIFIIYAVINDPTQAADFTANIWDRIKDGLSAVGTFFDSLLSS